MEQILRNYIKNKSNKENNNVSIPKIDVKKKDYDTIVTLVDNDDNKPIITPIAKQKKRQLFFFYFTVMLNEKP